MMKQLSVLCAVVLTLSLLLCGCAGEKGSAVSGVTGNPESSRSSSDAPGEKDASGSGAESTAPVDEAADPSDGQAADPVDPSDSSVPADQKAPGSLSSAYPQVNPSTPIALLYNEPWTNGTLKPTVVWNEGEFDRLYIVPRYVGTVIRAYRVTEDDSGDVSLAPEPAFSTVAEDGCVIYAALDRPEGFPCWYLEAELYDGRRAGMFLEYNGRYGTPRYEYLELNDMDTLLGEEADPALLSEMIGTWGEKHFWDFWHGAELAGAKNWTEAGRCFSQMTEIGDGAAFTRSQAGDFYNGSYHFQIARFHSNYYEPSDTLAESVTAQYEKYRKIGNALGILGPDKDDDGVELTYCLTGVSIFNPILAAKEVELIVNGQSIGKYTLPADRFCTLIPLDLPEVPADKPMDVEVKVTAVYYGSPEDAFIEAEAGIGGNISGAL